ncbi:hypothetical protein ACFY00_37495 [Kitasatospora sp. NPDC001540]
MPVHWVADWYCGECGSSGQEHFEDDCWMASGHVCEEAVQA